MSDLVERLREANETRDAFVRAREAMNAAIPNVVTATPAERALYDERYKADHEAERAHFRAALTLFIDGKVSEAADRIEALESELTETSAALERLTGLAQRALEAMRAAGVVHDGDVHAGDPVLTDLAATPNRSQGGANVLVSGPVQAGGQAGGGANRSHGDDNG